MTSAVALISILAASKGPVTFKSSDGFFIVSRDGKAIQKLASVPGYTADELVASPDGRTFAFTAYSEAVSQPLLYVWTPPTAPRLVGSGVGFHAQPSFTNDGAWIYFIHHPTRGGPQGQHMAREFGQIWRVRSDGTVLKQITKTEGCKMGPDATNTGRLVYSHADCQHANLVETLFAGRTQQLTKHSDVKSLFPRLSQGGRTVATLRLGAEEVSLQLCDLHSVCRVIMKTQRDGEPRALAWLEGDTGLMIQLGNDVQRVDATTGQVTPMFSLTEASQ